MANECVCAVGWGRRFPAVLFCCTIIIKQPLNEMRGPETQAHVGYRDVEYLLTEKSWVHLLQS